jgi:hypothetical protein
MSLERRHCNLQVSYTFCLSNNGILIGFIEKNGVSKVLIDLLSFK